MGQDDNHWCELGFAEPAVVFKGPTQTARSIPDGAFGTMTARLAAANNPSLFVLSYDHAAARVTDLILVPSHFFTPEIIEARKPLGPHARRAAWTATRFLRDEGLKARGWLLAVMGAVEAVGRPEFTLAEVYAQEARLAALYPGNNNVRPKIRQQLQVLRDRGWLVFDGRGRYRRT